MAYQAVKIPGTLGQDKKNSINRGRILLEMNLDLVLHELRRVSFRSGLPEAEAEEFRSWALLKLVENDYRILARWEGRSSFSTYLGVSLVNLMRDYRRHVWGKWRPSAVALEHGHAAVLLERLWRGEGLSLDEAIERVMAEQGASPSRAELEQISTKLPQRLERRWVGEEALSQIPGEEQAETRVEEAEHLRTAVHLRNTLPSLLRALPSEERLLLKLYYSDGLTMTEISSILHRRRRELYLTRDRCLRKLRKALEKAGICAGRMSALVSRPLERFQLEDRLFEDCEEKAS